MLTFTGLKGVGGHTRKGKGVTASGHKTTQILDLALQLGEAGKSQGEQKETSKLEQKPGGERTQSLQSAKQGLPLFRG